MAYNQDNQRSDAQASEHYPHGWLDERTRQDENHPQQQKQGYLGYEHAHQANQQYNNTQQWVRRNKGQLDPNVLAEQQRQHYQYDPRYKSQNQVSGGLAGAKQYCPNGQVREKSRPRLDMKANTNFHERILPAKEPPVVVAWDNPFPVFSNEEYGQVKHSSLGKDRSKMRPPDQLDPSPQTSHSYKKGDNSRPHTAQDQRRPPRQPDSHTVPSAHQISVVNQPPPNCDTKGTRDNRQGLGDKRGPREPYSYVPSPISPISVLPVTQQVSGNATMPAAAPPDASILFEMPDFDAISTSASERTEDPLHVLSDNARPAYQKATYQAPIDGSMSGSQPRPGLQRSQTTPGHLAEFSFGLPAGLDRSQPPSNPHTSVAGSQKPLRSQLVTEQYPPMPAGRQGYQRHPSANSEETYRTLEQPLYHSEGEAQNYAAEIGPSNPGPAYGYSQADQGGISEFQQSRRFELRGRYYQGPSQELQGFSQDQSQYPGQTNHLPDPWNGSQHPRSQTPGSVYPSPLRQYSAENTSSPLNPDALPTHPVPIRPGHLQRTSSAPVHMAEGSRTVNGPPSSTNTVAHPTTFQKEKPPAVTPHDLNLLLQAVKRNPKDHQIRLNLAKKLVEAASELPKEGRKADSKVTQSSRARYISDAHEYLKLLVDQGYAEAMFYLAECYGQGSIGLRANPKEAFRLYSSAAKAGHAQAAYRVAVCCEMGNEEGGGTRRDAFKAVDWYKKAASMEDTPAIYKLGIIQLKGLLGQPRNVKEAVSCLERAAARADRENPHALHELGLLYETASGSDMIVRDEKYALELFMQAAELGYKFSEFRLGSAYEYGTLGCPSDAHESIAWYTRAAAQEEHQSELALGSWYFTGADGILQQSDTEAYLWARKAANSRLAKAEYAMGYLTEVGIGCGANLDEAKKWYWRAASQNFPEARKRLEELKRGGSMKKTRVPHRALHRQNEGECPVM